MSIQIKGVTKKFEDKIALNNVSLEFKEKQITGLIGFNGSGKTTLYNSIVRFYEDYTGEITVGGKPILQEDLKFFTYLAAGAEPQNPTRVKKHLLQIAELYDLKHKDAWEVIYKYAKQMDFEHLLNKPIKSLSKGNQQKIKVVAALLNKEARFILLDEPFDGLDPIMVKRVQKIFMQLKDKTIILTSHRMHVIQEMCQEFYVLKDGEVISSKKTEDTILEIEVNNEVKLAAIKKLDYVIDVREKENSNIIIFNGIENFKTLNKKLINDPKYVFSSLKSKNIAEAVFEGYGD